MHSLFFKTHKLLYEVGHTQYYNATESVSQKNISLLVIMTLGYNSQVTNFLIAVHKLEISVSLI